MSTSSRRAEATPTTAVEGAEVRVAPGSMDPSATSPCVLELNHARTDEEGELRPLFDAEQRVDAPERAHDRIAKPLCAANAGGGGLTELGRVEDLSRDGICETGDRSPLVDSDLRALRLYLVEDARQLGRLLLVELEAVREIA